MKNSNKSGSAQSQSNKSTRSGANDKRMQDSSKADKAAGKTQDQYQKNSSPKK